MMALTRRSTISKTLALLLCMSAVSEGKSQYGSPFDDEIALVQKKVSRDTSSWSRAKMSPANIDKSFRQIEQSCNSLESKLKQNEKTEYLSEYVPIIKNTLFEYAIKEPELLDPSTNGTDYLDPSLYIAIIAKKIGRNPFADGYYLNDPMKITQPRTRFLHESGQLTILKSGINGTSRLFNYDDSRQFRDMKTTSGFQEPGINFDERMNKELSIRAGISMVIGSARKKGGFIEKGEIKEYTAKQEWTDPYLREFLDVYEIKWDNTLGPDGSKRITKGTIVEYTDYKQMGPRYTYETVEKGLQKYYFPLTKVKDTRETIKMQRIIQRM